jgi:3-methyl-2-oxobutanoate hydroxymethyltransferase
MQTESCHVTGNKAREKLTVAGLLALKGQRKLVLTTAFDEWTARAAEVASVDMILAWGSCLEHSKFVIASVRKGAPNTLIGSGINPEAYESVERAINAANQIRAAGTDIIYCSGLVPEKFAALSRQHFPCVGHVGYLPVNDTWYGGPRAVGKTADEAKRVFDNVMALEEAGCIAVEMECVPARIAAEISKRTKLLVFSMGSGPDCDGQFIFSEDILGTHSGHFPRHAYRKLNLMEQSVDALRQYTNDVLSGAYPTPKHNILIQDEEFEKFMAMISDTRVVVVFPPTFLCCAGIQRYCDSACANTTSKFEKKMLKRWYLKSDS